MAAETIPLPGAAGEALEPEAPTEVPAVGALETGAMLEALAARTQAAT
jgi:hypothetical protein